MEIISELVAECTEPGEERTVARQGEQGYRGCTVREPLVIPQGWNRRSYKKVALDGVAECGQC